MKKIVFYLLFATLFSCVALKKVDKRFVGMWEGEDKGTIGTMTFQSDKNIIVCIPSQKVKLGGEGYEQNGKKLAMTYEIDSKTKPIELDLITTDIETKKEQKRLKLIAEFIDKNTLKLGASMSKERPKDFNIKEEVIILHRIK